MCLLPPPPAKPGLAESDSTNPRNGPEWDWALICNKKLWKRLLQTLPELGNASINTQFMQKAPKSYWERSFIPKPATELRCRGNFRMVWMWQSLEAEGEEGSPGWELSALCSSSLLPGCLWNFVVLLFPVRNAETALGWVLLQVYPSGKPLTPPTCNPQGFSGWTFLVF